MSSTIPLRVLAGVTVPNTPLITKALDYAKVNVDEHIYNHVVRSWLFGTYIADHVPDLKERDTELHAVCAILHDLGWASTPEFISVDKRFEVDGANAAREFLLKEGGVLWDKQRIQLAWDAIALHTTASIAWEKEVEVKICSMGIISDFVGPEGSPGGVLTRKVWEGIVKEFPRTDFKTGVKKALCGLCEKKPETTYDNFVSGFGVRFVEGYSLEGREMVDVVMGMKE